MTAPTPPFRQRPAVQHDDSVLVLATTSGGESGQVGRVLPQRFQPRHGDILAVEFDSPEGGAWVVDATSWARVGRIVAEHPDGYPDGLGRIAVEGPAPGPGSWVIALDLEGAVDSSTPVQVENGPREVCHGIGVLIPAPHGKQVWECWRWALIEPDPSGDAR